MQAVIYTKLTNGLPGTTPIADLSDRTSEIEFTHSAMWGPLTARVSWGGSLDEGFAAADQWLGNPISIISPDGVVQWSGLVWSVRFSAGNRSRSRSLEGYANRVRVHYRLVIQDYTETNNTDQQAIYGIIEHQINAGELKTGTVGFISARAIAERTRLLWLPDSGGGDPRIELECYGWWRTLSYLAYRGTTSSLNDISTEIATILAAKAPFISTDTSNMALTGIGTSQTFDKWETVGEIIKRLMDQAEGSVFGIDNNRMPYVAASRRLATTPDYLEQADGTITGTAGQVIPPYEIRPNTIMRQVDFVPASANLSASIDSIESTFLAETTYKSSDNSLSYQSVVAGVLGEISE